MIPRWLKLAACAFIALLVPVYWLNYGPANFLWLSDLAWFATSAALVFESPVLAGIAVGVLPLELIAHPPVPDPRLPPGTPAPAAVTSWSRKPDRSGG